MYAQNLFASRSQHTARELESIGRKLTDLYNAQPEGPVRDMLYTLVREYYDSVEEILPRLKASRRR